MALGSKNKLAEIFAGGGLVWVFRNLPFVFFIGFLGAIYIANVHSAEKTVREIQSLQKDIKKLRWKYNSIKAEFMYESKQSEIFKKVKPLGLKSAKGKPKKIAVSNNGY